jgi:hypothetical protein
MGCVIYISKEDKKNAERADYEFLKKEIMPLLEWIKNDELKHIYKLNKTGLQKYPQLKNEIFQVAQIEQCFFETGMNPFELAIQRLNKNQK